MAKIVGIDLGTTNSVVAVMAARAALLRCATGKDLFMSQRIGIFVIAYNAETTLTHVLERIPADVVAKVEEIFVIDDCSPDNTYAVGRSYADGPAAAKLTVQRNPVNLMYGGNQKRGYQYAIERGLDIVVLLHGDGQYAPEVMQRLLAPLETGQAALVMGSRMLESGAALKGHMPLYKYIGNKILTATQNRLLGTHFSEFHSGYRAYSTQALRSRAARAAIRTMSRLYATKLILCRCYSSECASGALLASQQKAEPA